MFAFTALSLIASCLYTLLMEPPASPLMRTAVRFVWTRNSDSLETSMVLFWRTLQPIEHALGRSRTICTRDSRPHCKTKIRNWLLVVGWAGLISYFSTDHFSDLNTGETLGLVLSWLFPNIPIDDIESVHRIIRKLGHWSEYFILSALVLWALQNEPERKSKLRQAVYTLIFVLLYASGDEFHQSFVPSRTASFGDVMINMLGGVCGISLTIIATLTARTKRKLEVASHQKIAVKLVIASHRFRD
jgi:VanZ family protein